jgi:hypothetical protein
MTLKKKRKPKVRLYDVISSAVENGVRAGVYRAYKHTDTPSTDHLQFEVHNCVMGALSDVLDCE